MNKKIEKLDPAFMGTNAGSAGASLDEVVLKINEVIDVLNGEPELAESEDERIRKEIVGVIQKHYPNTPESYRWISWLEKQKEPTKEELYAEAGTTEKEYIANTMKMVRAMREKKQEQKPAESSTNLDELMDDYFANFKVPEHQIIFEDTFRKIAKDFYELGHNSRPVEWSEKDKKILDDVSHILIGLNYKQIAKDYKQAVEKLIYARPSWKPSEIHKTALLMVIRDPNNAGSESCQLALRDLLEQLKAL